jgi:hypothetical protein
MVPNKDWSDLSSKDRSGKFSRVGLRIASESIGRARIRSVLWGMLAHNSTWYREVFALPVKERTLKSFAEAPPIETWICVKSPVILPMLKDDSKIFKMA